ncbi:choice-of-anchor V domain-containing protein [Fodinibius sp.]|uniref:choice-of-anchor V domain-containing protein n=1 Tax=Fodinibius sp. TaxID=1872440 RepID=UPI003564AA95
MLRLLIPPVVTLLMAFTLSENPSVPVTEDHSAYPEHLTGAFTGGFGEQTCRSCHFDYDLNPGEGRLSVSGVPGRITGGETLELRIRLEREELGRAGFQLSARYAEGKQAGSFEIGDNDRMMFSKAAPDSVEYLQHSSRGSEPLREQETSWTVTWRAPQSLAGPVTFHVAANAANGDQSEFGDFIYTEEITANPD